MSEKSRENELLRFAQNDDRVQPRLLPQAARSSRGFSLAELLVVLTLLAIIMAAIVPLFAGSFLDIEADYAVRDIVALLKYAQERAVTDTIPYRFYMNVDSGEYWLASETDVNGAFEFREVKEHQSERRKLPEGIQMDKPKAREDKESGTYYIEFSPSGWCDVARIELKKNHTLLSRIRTTGAVGRIIVGDK